MSEALKRAISPLAKTAEMAPFELLGLHDSDSLVAFGGAGEKRAADLLADAARVSSALPPPAENSHVLLLFEKDRYAMAAALLGALDRGHAVALPSSSRRDSILAVRARPETVAIVHDTDSGATFRSSELLDAASKYDDDVRLASPVVVHPGLIATVFTSGTMGPMTPWPKTAGELLGEARALGTTFDVEAGSRIVGAVAPGHIYGLLFTVLLPLLRGAAFSRDTPHHAETIGHALQQHEADILVAVPVQLNALTALPKGSLASLGRVFSSTGPLPEVTAQKFAQHFDVPITEIFGSTETGGIAFRIRADNRNAAWQPFDGVQIASSADNRLTVDSPFLHADLPRPYETADLVELNEDGGFQHLGRADGIVKIGGRRVSLQEVEDVIRQHPEIEDAAVVAVPVETGRGHQLLAAFVPASTGPEDPTNDLKQALRKKFEPSCLPKRFLAVDEIPKEANGKLQRARLLRLFDRQGDGRPLNWTIEWGEPTIESESGAQQFEIPAHIPADYAWFEGHFDNYPVLAGAVQLKELILPTVQRAFPELGSVVSMSRVKFGGRIVPGDDVFVRVERGRALDRVQFEIRKVDETCVRGTLVHSLGSTA